MVDYHSASLRRQRPWRRSEHISKSEMAVPVVLGLVMSALFFCHCWLHISRLSLGYQIEQLKQENEELREQNRALALEQASLESPQRVDALARSNLGMVPVQHPAVVIVREMESPDQQLLALAAEDTLKTKAAGH